MPDNIPYTPGSGASIAADGSNPDGALRQRIKVQTGVEGIAQDVASGQGLPIVLDDMILRRIVKLLETLSIVDQQNRQRITIDNIAGSSTLPTVSNLTNITNPVPVGAVASVTAAVPVGNVATIASMDREQYINIARTAYNTGIRAKLA